MIEHVVTGGQTGCDQAGLRAARACGITTGGYAPKGFLTEDGPAPWLADYGLEEHPSRDYPPRTEANLKLAGFVVCIEAGSFPHWSRGTRLLVSLTQRDQGDGGARSEPPRAIVELGGIHLGRPIDLPVRSGLGYYGMNANGTGFRLRRDYQSPARIVEQIRRSGASVLMLAGNRESHHPGIGKAAEEFFLEMLTISKGL